MINQISFLIIHFLIGVISLNMRMQNQQQCKTLYILVVNSLSLIVFSQYMEGIYFLIASLFSSAILIQNIQKEKQQSSESIQHYSYLLIILVIYLLQGGIQYLQSFLKTEKLVNYKEDDNYLSKYGLSADNFLKQTGYFSRNTFIEEPEPQLKPLLKRGIYNMDQHTQIIRKQDQHFLKYANNDFGKYDDDLEYMFIQEPQQWEINKRDYIFNIYKQFTYFVQQFKQLGQKYPFSLTGTFYLFQSMIYKTLTEEQINEVINENMFDEQDKQFNEYAIKIFENSTLYLYLFFVVKPFTTKRIYILVNRERNYLEINNNPSSQLYNRILQLQKEKEEKEQEKEMLRLQHINEQLKNEEDEEEKGLQQVLQ